MDRNRMRFVLLAGTLTVMLLLSAACSQPEPAPATSTPSSSADNGSEVESESPEVTEPTAPPPSTDESGYPADSAESAYPADDVESAYPATEDEPATNGESATEDAYPPPQADEAVGGPRGPNFSLDQPLEAGTTTVTGQAPTELSLAIVDVTFAGEIIGTGRSDADGEFSIEVSPLPEGHRIGVTISSLEGDQTMEEFAEEYFPYRGQGFSNVPNIGVFFDTALVQP